MTNPSTGHISVISVSDVSLRLANPCVHAGLQTRVKDVVVALGAMAEWRGPACCFSGRPSVGASLPSRFQKQQQFHDTKVGSGGHGMRVRPVTPGCSRVSAGGPFAGQPGAPPPRRHPPCPAPQSKEPRVRRGCAVRGVLASAAHQGSRAAAGRVPLGAWTSSGHTGATHSLLQAPDCLLMRHLALGPPASRRLSAPCEH